MIQLTGAFRIDTSSSINSLDAISFTNISPPFFTQVSTSYVKLLINQKKKITWQKHNNIFTESVAS